MAKLKVGDIVRDFKESDLKGIVDSMKVLNNICKDYADIKSIRSANEMDTLKRDFIGHFQHFAEMFSKVKRYKGSSHTYLEEERKRIKSEAIRKMLESKEANNVTAAKELVYSYDYYIDRIDLLQDLLKFFIKTENMYDYYSDTLQCIIQSISVAGKEKHVG